MEKEALLQQVKQTVQQIDPQAEVILFGSRARGDARPDSDWDILVLTHQPLTTALKHQLVDALYHSVELRYNEVVTPIIFEKHDWERRHSVTLLYQAITQEGLTT